jgi:hypothetical protein
LARADAPALGRLDEALADMEKEVSPIFKLVGTSIVQHARGEFAASDAALAALISEYGGDSPYQVARGLRWRGGRRQGVRVARKDVCRP